MTTNRITGMVSGLDTEALVKQMMSLSQNRYDNLMKKKTELEWKKQLYSDIHAELKNLDKKIFDASLSSFNNPKTATSTNEAIATVSASGNASNISHTLKVISLATGASMTSSEKIGSTANKSSIASQLGLEANKEIELTLTSEGKDPVTIKINTDKSLSDLVSEINKKGKDLGIKATYDSNTDRFFINSTGMGADTNFSLKADSGSAGEALMNALKLGQDGVADTTSTLDGMSAGKSAVIELDGTRFEEKSNDFTIAGLTFSLKAAAPDQTIMVGVKSDTSKLVENIKGLVESYNNLLELINGKTSEKYYRNYGALTDEQRKEMSDKEIELWEEKAKSGILRNDSTLTGLTSKLRTAMYSSYNVDGKFTTMASIGISTKTYTDKGKLTIDEKKLTEALEKDPEAVSKLFSGSGGLVDSLRDSIKNTMRKLEDTAGAGVPYDTQSSLAKQIDSYTDKMTSLAAKMVKEENRYYTQFASMEKTLASMNNNGSYLTSMMGS